MKVLEINTVCGTLSTGRIASDIATAVNKRGDSAVVAFGRKPLGAGCDDIAYYFGSKVSFLWQAFLARLFDNEGFGCVGNTKKLIQYIDNYQPDIIHLHNLHGYYLNIDLLFEYISQKHIPVVWTLHDCWAFTGHCAYFDGCGCDKWRSQCGRCPLKNTYPKSLLFDSSSTLFQKKKKLYDKITNMVIVSPSKWLDGLVKLSMLNRFDSKVIYNGVNTNVFSKKTSDYFEKFGIADKRIVLGVAASWEPRKGLSDFVFLAERLPQNYQIVLVGAINSTKTSSLPSNILCIPSTDSPTELAHIYSSASVFVNPTYQDNYPTTNIEAISCGIPVITYNTGGSPESAEYYGNIVEKGNKEQLLSAVLSYDGIEKNENFDFSRERMINEYIKLYDELLKKSRES